MHSDARGSCRQVTDSDGSVVAQLEETAWGERLDGAFDSVSGVRAMIRWLGAGPRDDSGNAIPRPPTPN